MSGLIQAIDTTTEVGSYELLWRDAKASLKSVSEKMKDQLIPLVDPNEAQKAMVTLLEELKRKGIDDFGFLLEDTLDYPEPLHDDPNPPRVLYFRGDFSLLHKKNKVSVVGTRCPSGLGVKRAEAVTRFLVTHGYVVVSGLAKGIDTIAHTTALKLGGKTIGVIGTPITESYPAENRELQNVIATKHLLLSHIPVSRVLAYPNPRFNRFLFKERNRIMSAISEATIIIEAGETSGTRSQARAAIQQQRKLFILENVVEAHDWAKKFVDQGAMVVKGVPDLERFLGETSKN